MGQTLYLFIDESGNFDFSQKGSKYFVLTSVATLRPAEERDQFLSLKYRFLREKDSGMRDFFHATEDLQRVRDDVFELIRKSKDFAIDAVIAQKNRTNPMLFQRTEVRSSTDGKTYQKTVKTEEEFYRMVSHALLKYVFSRYGSLSHIDNVVVVLGAIFTKNKHDFILKYLKTYLKEYFKKPFFIYFHPVRSDINCQIADYCGWALFVKWERGEERPYNLIKNKVQSEFEIFKTGNTEYY